MKWTFELKIWAVALVFLLLGQAVGLRAAHGVIPARELEQPRHLLHAQVPLLAHGRPAGWAVGQPGEAVRTHQVALHALFDGWGDVVQADGALEQGEEGVCVDQPQLQVGLLQHHGVHPVYLVSLAQENLIL